MKNYIFVFLLLLGASIQANDIFYSYGSFSYLPTIKGVDKKYFNWVIDSDHFFKSSIAAGFEYKIVFAEAEAVTNMYKARSFMFQPYTQEYYTRIGIKYGRIKIQWEHLCIHSIDDLGATGGHDEISILFDTRGFK